MAGNTQTFDRDLFDLDVEEGDQVITPGPMYYWQVLKVNKDSVECVQINGTESGSVH